MDKQKTNTPNRILQAVILAAGLSVLVPASNVSAEAISHAYQTDSQNVTKGALLSLVNDRSSQVEPANSTKNGSKLVGVAADEPLLELSSKAGRSTQVVIEGTTDVMVSDLNGDIRMGDKITASPVNGIGMKAVAAAEVVGTAQADFTSVRTVTRQITSQDGAVRSLRVGLLPAAVNVTFYSSGAMTDRLAAYVPTVLQTVANTIAGKPVAPIKVLLSSAAMLMGVVIVIVILQSGVRSGVISIGRNPMAYSMLRRGLIDVIVGAIAILVLSGVTSYGLLVT